MLDLSSLLVGAGSMLALAASLLTARWLLARGIPGDSPPSAPGLSDLAALVASRPTLAQVEELIATRNATLRADLNAIAESVDSNLDAIDRTRRRVAARRDGQVPQPPPPNVSPAALAFLQGHR